MQRDGRIYRTEPLPRLVMEKLLEKRGRPAVRAGRENPNPTFCLAALEVLMEWHDEVEHEAIQKVLQGGLQEADASTVIAFLSLAARRDLAALEEPIWKLFEHKSKPVRAAAARALAKLGDVAVTRAGELLTSKKAAARMAAVWLLADARTPQAVRLLEARLDDEPDEEVRDQILLALERAWETHGRQLTLGEIEARVERAAAKLARPLAAWLDEARLPPLRVAATGQELPKQMVRYLLYRQSRAKEMRPDVEAKPLLALIDRRTSGDFAMSLLRMFLGSKMEAADRWALAVAGLLGDDRLVAPLMQQIRTWVDNARGKLAEYAAQALALLGTDAALCAVDALAIRYRSKQKNIGKAAGEAFAEAAERLNMTVDELGDRVVPWMGFQPGKERVLEHNGKRVEIRVGLDFKIELRDLAKGKRIASLPAGFPAEAKAELKELGATIREVVKGQLVRMENLMVRQYRWPLARWRALYLAHPLLFPFAARLVWGLYGPDGRLQTAFRALEDRTLTNERDEEVELPSGGAETVGIVHPLELTSQQRQAWRAHVADYDVEPPFLQLERPVIHVADDERDTKMSSKYKGTEINAMTFKGRAEKLGWQRGSVTDAGGISCYRKSFPGAGADAILGLDGMFIGIDMYSNITLQEFCFVKSGSVTFGSYVYDEPANAKDARLIPFGQVPPIVYSEVVGDLARIAGKQAAGDDEAG